MKPNKKRKRDYVEDVNEDAATKRRKAESIELIKELSSSWTPVRRSLRVKGIVSIHKVTSTCFMKIGVLSASLLILSGCCEYGGDLLGAETFLLL